MDRLDVLKHYRDFEVPCDEEDYQYRNWHEWKKNVLNHPAVKETLQPRDAIYKAYKGYADCTIRSGHYYTYYAKKEKMPEWLKTDELVEPQQPDPNLSDLEMKDWPDVRDETKK